MRILYVAFAEESDSGVIRKISAQVKSLKANDVNVKLVIFSNKPFLGELPGINVSATAKAQKKGRLANRIGKMRELVDLVIREECDFLYMRYLNFADPWLLWAIRRVKVPVITEHQTLELKEHIMKKAYIPSILELLFGGLFRRRVAGLVCVTKGIADYELRRTRGSSKPYLVNGNGIDVNSAPLRTPPVFDGKNLDLLCVAHVAKWHGLDRLVKGMAEYKGNVDVRLHIAGDGSEVPNLKRLVADLKLENSVVFHGFKTGEELDVLFDKCHIAAGSLGLHRVGVSEGSILKVREYCARGIPFIYGAMDSDFNEKFPYILRVPADESPIDLNAVFSFADSALSDTEHSVKMREYAKENLDWSIKMKKLIDFMNEILESKMRK